MAKKIYVAGTGPVDPATYAFTSRAVQVLRAYGPFSVGIVIPNMPAAERELRIRTHQVEPYAPPKARPKKTPPGPAQLPAPVGFV
jgi:hypothetical protein